MAADARHKLLPQTFFFQGPFSSEASPLLSPCWTCASAAALGRCCVGSCCHVRPRLAPCTPFAELLVLCFALFCVLFACFAVLLVLQPSVLALAARWLGCCECPAGVSVRPPPIIPQLVTIQSRSAADVTVSCVPRKPATPLAAAVTTFSNWLQLGWRWPLAVIALHSLNICVGTGYTLFDLLCCCVFAGCPLDACTTPLEQRQLVVRGTPQLSALLPAAAACLSLLPGEH